VKHIMSIDGRETLEYTSKQGHQRLVHKNGTEVACVGANTENAQDRVFGKSVYMWYADEVQKQPASFVQIAVSRCRWAIDGVLDGDRPRLWTLNPDEAPHAVKTEYIDRFDLMDGKSWFFDFLDNPTIQNPEQYKQELALRMGGSLRERLVFGQWTSSLSAVVPEFLDHEKGIVQDNPRPEYFDCYGALDPAYHDYTAYLVGYYDFLKAKIVIENEFFRNKINSAEIAKEISACEQYAFGDKKFQSRVSDIDPILIADLNELHKISIAPTRKDDKEAQINNLRVLTENERYIINPRCKNLIRQLRNASWDKNGKEFARIEGEGHFDLIDAMIYLIRNIEKNRNPYPVIPVGVTKDNYYITEELIRAQKLKGAEQLATALARRKL